jgi:hypothetical protein
MPKNIHLVYSKPPDDLSDDEFNRWYDPHLDEILVVPGFVAAQRYTLEPQVNTHGLDLPFRYLSLYELEGDVDTIMKDLDEEAASGRMKLPDWFPETTFASWNARPIGERAVAKR